MIKTLSVLAAILFAIGCSTLSPSKPRDEIKEKRGVSSTQTEFRWFGSPGIVQFYKNGFSGKGFQTGCYEVDLETGGYKYNTIASDSACKTSGMKTENRWFGDSGIAQFYKNGLSGKGFQTGCYEVDLETGGYKYNSPVSDFECKAPGMKTEYKWFGDSGIVQFYKNGLSGKGLHTGCYEVDVDTGGYKYNGVVSDYYCSK